MIKADVTPMAGTGNRHHYHIPQEEYKEIAHFYSQTLSHSEACDHISCKHWQLVALVNHELVHSIRIFKLAITGDTTPKN
ncbi:MAG: hypothetical protein IPG66_19080 [Hydrogenophilales bacterium]|nr:hypothetical protein [Hydrogenophilales bacterium]